MEADTVEKAQLADFFLKLLLHLIASDIQMEFPRELCGEVFHGR